jgi:phosphoribosylaminoimidazole-succinocarboxamide synthase
MAHVPDHVKDGSIIPSLRKKLASQGKVRDMYHVPGESEQLLMVASDRVSIFDLVLPFLIPFKGEVLTALTHFWMTKVLVNLPNHLINNRDGYNIVINLARSYRDVPTRQALIVHRAEVIPFELIFRGHLGGSVWKKYLNTGIVAGVQLPAELTKWSTMPSPLFTPSTKAENGHDVNITVDEFYQGAGDWAGGAEAITRRAYREAYTFAADKGILILDTKFEVGMINGKPSLIDETLTPDSSRFTLVEGFDQVLAANRDPEFYDKEPVRDWGKELETPFGVTGIHKLDPGNTEHLAWIDSLETPLEVVGKTTVRYLDIFKKLTGQKLKDYQREHMGIVDQSDTFIK